FPLRRVAVALYVCVLPLILVVVDFVADIPFAFRGTSTARSVGAASTAERGSARITDHFASLDIMLDSSRLPRPAISVRGGQGQAGGAEGGHPRCKVARLSYFPS